MRAGTAPGSLPEWAPSLCCLPGFIFPILTVAPRHMSEPAVEGNHVRDAVTVPSKSIICINALIKAKRAQERAAAPRSHEYCEKN